MQTNFSAKELRPFRDRDVVWFTPLLPFVFGGAMYLMIVLSNYLEASLPLPTAFLPFTLARKAVGAVAAVLGLSFFTLGTGRLLLFLRKKRSRPFINSGVYRYTRNPSYFGIMTALFGVAFIMNSVAMLLIALVVLVLFTISVQITDKIMYRIYGEEFHSYHESTPRFIPAFNKLIRNIFGLD
jgi:protein-S-isoprenylcysteine O-methyltransferase Ste14